MLGHQKVLATLKTAIENNNVGHAYIFEGPDGVGKRETALAFSAMIMCQSEIYPCWQCKSCQLFQQGSNPDFQEIILEDKSISVEDIRNVLNGLVIKPLYSKYKVIIINDADNMTIQAQNALLKSLEEPPSYVIFILTVQSSAALAQTVRSRCQRILFNKLGNDEILKALETRCDQKDIDLNFIVSYADGVIGTALKLINSPHTLELREQVMRMAAELLSPQSSDLFSMYDIFEKNNDNINYILGIMLLYFRDVLVFNITKNISLLINSDKKDMIIRNAGANTSSLIKCIQAIWDAYRALEFNANFQLAIEVMLMKIGQTKNTF